MKKNLGQLLLAIYLIVGGAIGLFGISLGQLSFLLPVLAIAAGILLLLGK
jgi:sulfite exporter TauE/SafE